MDSGHSRCMKVLIHLKEFISRIYLTIWCLVQRKYCCLLLNIYQFETNFKLIPWLFVIMLSIKCLRFTYRSIYVYVYQSYSQNLCKESINFILKLFTYFTRVSKLECISYVALIWKIFWVNVNCCWSLVCKHVQPTVQSFLECSNIFIFKSEVKRSQKTCIIITAVRCLVFDVNFKTRTNFNVLYCCGHFMVLT